MAEAAPPKKRKLTHDWLVHQLHDFEEDVKENVANHLFDFDENDLKNAPVSSLLSLLPQELESKTRQKVALRLENKIREVFRPPDPGYQDELCHWLDEAVSKTPKPSNWEADTVQEFAHNILGKRDMNKRLVLRKCYMDMCSLVHKWLLHNFSQEDMGVFVITGTPGIGKSVFLAYVASRLAEEGINIVIQLGKRWWSRISGQTITMHTEKKRDMLLDQSKTVLLADPVRGENSQPVDPRMRGCTIIFTSPQQKNYDSVWKQAEGRSKRYFMPVWSEEEVLNHWKAGGILQICKEEADVKKAYSMIGGSVRYLHKLLVAVAENKTTLEEEAKQMIRDCVVKCTFEDLCQAADSGGADMDAQNNRSKMSRVLHIHSDAKFQTPNVKLIESEVMQMAQSRRATSATDANAVSSRSHAVCILRLLQCEGQLMLVDCAGTERRKDSMYHSKERQQEGAEINASLHALKADC
ncbi:unnamed protein product [Effrenium voratum]|nr:unnamed protein product [Effrenium voratum]